MTDIEMDHMGGHQGLLPESQSNYDIRRSAHPLACIFHILFKAGGFFAYLFLGLFMDSRLLQYIVVVLCDAFDFWTVKNVTGRLLVGLRWWSTFTPRGKEVWKFESLPKENSVVDSSIFWTFQLGATGTWFAFAVLNAMTLSLSNVIMTSLGGILSGINLWGYYKCSKDQQSKLKGVRDMVAQKGIMYAMKR